MNKKLITISSVAAVALALIAVLFCALVPCVHGLTPFQASSAKRFFKNNPFRVEKAEERAELSVAAAVGANGYERNTFVGSRIQMEREPDYIELNLAVNDAGTLVLADSYFDTSEKSIRAERVAKALLESTARTSLLVNLAEYTNLNEAAALLLGSGRFQNAVIRGVDENTLSYVRGFFPSHTLLCEYSSANKLSLSELRALGADGVYCSASMLSTHFARKVHDAGLLLWVDCGDSAGRLIKTMKLAHSVDGLVTKKPVLALTMKNAESYQSFMQTIQKG